MKYARIMIIGNGGAGKSTLSRQIHKITGLPLFHLDQYFWKEGWQESDKQEWAKKVKELADRESWILDGNYGGTMDIRLEKADMVVFLNLSKWVCTWGVIKRSIQFYGKSRPDMTQGCPERFSWEFFHYVWNYKSTRSSGILTKLAQLSPQQKVIIIEKRRELIDLLRTFARKPPNDKG